MMTQEACKEITIASQSGTVHRYLSMMLEIQHTADVKKIADTGGRTMDSYHYDVAQFCEYVASNGLALVDGLEEWIRHIKGTCRARTVNRKLAAVRARILGSRSADGLLDVLGDEIPASERARIEYTMRKIRGVKVNSNAVRGAKVMDYQSEIPALLDGITDPVVKLVIEFMVHTGARISEVLSVQHQWCEAEADVVHMWLRGKGEKERECWIPADLYARIVDTFHGDTFLFEHNWYGTRRPYNSRSMTTRIKRWCVEILGRELSAHAFRHSAATHWLRDRSLDAKKVAKLLGHKSVSTTLDIYDGYVVSAADARLVIGA